MLRLLDIGIPRTGTVYREQTIEGGVTVLVHERRHYNFTGREKVGAMTKVGEVLQPTFTMCDFNDQFYRDSFVYFVYRDPLDLLVSHWAFLKREDVQQHHFDSNLSEASFVDYFDIVTKRETKYPNRDMLYWQCFDEKGRFIPKAVVMYEQMDLGLKELADLTDARYKRDEKINASKHTDYMKYYTTGMIQKAHKVYAKDFSLLDDYDVIPLPRQKV